MITVPYWWDETVESIAGTIRNRRPDIDLPNSLLASRKTISYERPWSREEFEVPRVQELPNYNIKLEGYYMY